MLARLSIAANDGATPGVSHLVLDPPGAAHVDPQNDGHVPQSLNHAVVAIDSGCPTEQPEPSFPPGPTQTPGPTTSAPGGTTPPRTSPHTPTNTPATAPTSTPAPTPPPTPTPPPDQPIPTPTPAGLPATGGNGPSASGELLLIGFALAVLVLAGVALQGATNAPER